MSDTSGCAPVEEVVVVEEEEEEAPLLSHESKRRRRDQYGIEAMLKGAGRLVSPSQSCLGFGLGVGF